MKLAKDTEDLRIMLDASVLDEESKWLHMKEINTCKVRGR